MSFNSCLIGKNAFANWLDLFTFPGSKLHSAPTFVKSKQKKRQNSTENIIVYNVVFVAIQMAFCFHRIIANGFVFIDRNRLSGLLFLLINNRTKVNDLLIAQMQKVKTENNKINPSQVNQVIILENKVLGQMLKISLRISERFA